MTLQNEDRTLTWLNIPPASIVNPPVETRKQDLPFGELSWEDFERLCYRLARSNADIEHCQPYGIRGQKQEGIDIYAKLKKDNIYVVYQCKREENFEPPKIKSAITKFLEGKWAEKAKMFVLCAEESLKSTNRANEVEAQRERLNEKGIKLEVWDSTQLSTELKNYPRIVDDFFGRPWVKAFLGDDEEKKLGNRLDVQQVASFRQLCSRFYKHVFRTHDFGLPIAEPGEANSLALEDRYIIPDISESKNIRSQSKESQGKFICEENDASLSIEEAIENKKELIVSKVQKRQSIEEWLISTPDSIVIGGPGSGKSTLLRFIAIDLLSENPQLIQISKFWGQYLPVWIPFALWTKIISEPSTNSCSLTDLLINWLKSYEEERLSPLIKQALDDERLLLLVDGLDEYANEQSASIAFGRLQVFIRQRNIPAIITSRPNGFKHLSGIRDSEWKLGELSDFSIDQQKALSKIWLIHKIKSQKKINDNTEIERMANFEAEKFIIELQKSKDLRELAKIPLLLCLLIFHKIHNTRLPQNRFKAYDSLIYYIICDHPQRRRIAASVIDTFCELSEDDIKKILSKLAYFMHESYSEGSIDQNIATNAIRDYLGDPENGLGFGQRESSKLSSELLNISENTIGILVKKSPAEIGFFHRVFQEFLTSQHISYLSLTEQLDIIERHCDDPQWKEVILGLFFITNRIEDIGKYIDTIKKKAESVTKIEQFTIELLLAEASFGEYNCSTALARRLAKETFDNIELSLWMPHRENLLNHALDGLRSTKVKELVKLKLLEWFPCRIYPREYLMDALTNWPFDESLLDYIWRGIRDERVECQRSAAKALAKIKNNDPIIGDKIELLAKQSNNSLVRASAIDALLKGWPAHKSIPNLIGSARNSSVPELRLIAILGKIQYNKQTDNDLDELLRLISKEFRISTRINVWEEDVIGAIIKGWPRSEIIKRNFLNVLIRSRFFESEKIMVRILLEGYPQDTDIAKFFADRIRKDSHVFFAWGPNRNPWDLMAKNFKNNEIIVPAIDEWIQKQNDSSEVEIARAALIGCSEDSKSKLLDTLNDSHYLHWPVYALIEGWGMQDQLVAQRLNQLAFGPTNKASLIAYLIPKIIDDKIICRNRLMDLLRDTSCERPDFVIEGLKTLEHVQYTDEIIDCVLNIINSANKIKDDIRDYTIFQLFSCFPSNERVREFAKRELLQGHPNYPAIAWTLGSYNEIRLKILEVICPLPVNLRRIIAERMEDEGDDEFALSLLQLYDQEIDENVRSEASISYHRRLSISGLDITMALDLLSKNIKCSGPILQSQRAAAFCGLVTLNRLDIIAECKEPRNLETPCKIPLDTYATNIPLIKTILQKWKDLKGTLGSEMLNRLALLHEEDIKNVWNSLCILADEYPLPRRDALEFLDTHAEKCAKSNILNFLSRTNPGSKLLSDYCMGSFYANQNGPKLGRDDETTAAKLLGSEFNYNKEIELNIKSYATKYNLYRILHDEIDYWQFSVPVPNGPILPNFMNKCKIASEERKLPYDSKIIIALCEGWPESQELDDIYRYVLEKNPSITYEPYFYLMSSKGTIDDIYHALIKTISRIDSEHVGPLYYIILPIVRRIKRDGMLAKKLINHLQNDPTPSEKVIIPKIISDANGLSPELKTWCLAELDRQFNENNILEIGIDLANGEPKAVTNALLEVLSKSTESD